MEVFEAILSRRTTHKYAPAPVDEAIVERALRAAHQAPNHKLTWPWRFTRFGAQARERLIELGLRLQAAEHALTEAQAEAVRAKLGNAAVLFAVGQVLDDDPVRAREDYAAVACAIQNMQLVACASGLGAKWSTGQITRHPETYAMLGIDAEVEEIVGFVWIGVPAQICEVPRPPLEDVIRTTA